MGRACGLLLIAAFAGCGAARGDTSARASADGGLERGQVDGGTRAPESGRRRDRCERDEDCVQTTRDAACCHTCLPRVVTRRRLLDEETHCAAAPSRPKCMEGDCSPATVQPACVEHRCAVKTPR